MSFQLPSLPYELSALEPYIDAATVALHHGKHHQAYVNNLNKAIAGTTLENRSLKELLHAVSKYGAAVRNNGGGHYNHTFFWDSLSQRGGVLPEGALEDAVVQYFGSVDHFKEAFAKAAATRFGSGWAWLYVREGGSLAVCSTPNQDNPLMDVVPAEHRGVPLLGLDVWEHAYYLHYQNRRADYIEAFWHLVDWEAVAKRYQQVL